MSDICGYLLKFFGCILENINPNAVHARSILFQAHLRGAFLLKNKRADVFELLHNSGNFAAAVAILRADIALERISPQAQVAFPYNPLVPVELVGFFAQIEGILLKAF